MAKRTVQFHGREVLGEEIEFEVEKESFNTYILHDGTKVKIKTVVSDVVRLDVHKEDGEPVYLLTSTNIVSAIVPENLKRKG